MIVKINNNNSLVFYLQYYNFSTINSGSRNWLLYTTTS